MKYIIRRVSLRYENGQKDKIKGPICTNNIESERTMIRAKYGCKSVGFEFIEPVTFLPELDPNHPQMVAEADDKCEC